MKKSICYDSKAKSHDHAKKNRKQNSNSTKSCNVISKLFLLEDLRFHILSFVPLNCLINSAMYVCKHWAATIGSSHFVEACERRARSKPGLYVENRTTRNKSYFLEFKDDVNCQFERIDLGTPQRMGGVISTCDGILLLFSSIFKELFIVNPVLKCWLRIPFSTIFQHYDEFSLRSRCTITRVPRTAKFKLFLFDVIEVSSVSWYVFYVLRIGIDNSWKEIARKEVGSNILLLQQIYSGGNDLYWATNKEVIVMDIDKESITREYSFSLLPLTFLMMGNRISCIVYKDGTHTTYQIYILDFHSGKWSLYHEMEPFNHVITSFGVFCLWINDQIIFRIALRSQENMSGNIKKIHYGYDVKTRKLTKIEDIDVGNFDVWLHTNTLASLPSTPT
ncbi:uncharacterized protein LOC123886380 [Trifolium pratense]|uniref:uncharacterized protein LOC123886380 n=1 Tax=Trifolium pratense TaxID=57577 RepID=UPI001E6907C3|nr:uncharacterized protein LOC123886380 [Trifolium pratense]